MDTVQIMEKIKERFGTWTLSSALKNSRRATICMMPEQILPVAQFLHTELGMRFISASALHTRQGFEIYYHFSMDSTGLVLNIHVVLPQENPEIESLSNMFSASDWIKREIHELFGISFRNHPNQEKLISEGNWAEGVYPYRKEFD